MLLVSRILGELMKRIGSVSLVSHKLCCKADAVKISIFKVFEGRLPTSKHVHISCVTFGKPTEITTLLLLLPHQYLPCPDPPNFNITLAPQPPHMAK